MLRMRRLKFNEAAHWTVYRLSLLALASKYEVYYSQTRLLKHIHFCLAILTLLCDSWSRRKKWDVLLLLAR